MRRNSYFKKMSKTEDMLPTGNPYANADGSPMPGKLAEFFEWMEEYIKALEAKMTPEERKEHERAKEHLARKMNS
jgi:hypothetical protein